MRRWLWMAFALFPLPAFLSEDPKQPSEADPAKSLRETKNGVVNQTETPQEMGKMEATSNSSQAPDRGPDAIATTPFRQTVAESVTEYKTRRLAKPSITVRSVNGTCNISANCVANGDDGDVHYLWSHTATDMIVSKSPELWVTQKPPDGSLDFVCTVRNAAGENASAVSLKNHCHEPSSFIQGASGSFYAKYLTPPLVVLVLLFALFFMYRRKRGIGTRSRTVSINESSDSDEEDCPHAAETVRPNVPPEAFKPIPEETLQTTEALNSGDSDETLDLRDPHSRQT
ncbi:uncharacterized protein LOC121915773 isoform X2 [Sceloporus undulatus]|uniref:uncharacterized protein LOC121915773 isoform X2 n=1 Tax=Sceloporus undulatus TaxID=8520 RepID=UPI001C4CA233|nr:uncharacterized protein LOC121915773 isoform X2 [Sceloporus undulatus]